MAQYIVDGHVASILPDNKKWILVWQDEFDGVTLDRSKWDYRLYMMHQRHNTFSDEGTAVLDGNSNLRLELVEKDGMFYTAQLQTGENYMDRPGDTGYGNFTWPIGKFKKPGFLHKYGYYEIRCKLQTQEGWWSAFWLQSPIIGATADGETSGVEVDIMESFNRDGLVEHTNHWGGYGQDHGSVTSGKYQLTGTEDGYHHFGVDWSRDGYIFYIDGKESWRVDRPVSDIEQFILISAEPWGYRWPDARGEKLKEAVLPDAFIVDYVRVFDEIR